MKHWLNIVFPWYAVITVAALMLYSIRPVLVSHLGEELEPSYWHYWVWFCLNAALAVGAYVTWRFKRPWLNVSLVAVIAGLHFVSVTARLFATEVGTMALVGIFLQVGLGLLFSVVARLLTR